MKSQATIPFRRLPVAFGVERKFSLSFRKSPVAIRVNGFGITLADLSPATRPLASPSPGCPSSAGAGAGGRRPVEGQGNQPIFPGEGRGEGGLKMVELKELVPVNPHIIYHSKLSRRGFTLVEILVVLALLSLIVFALMAVFSGTQRAFRASLTQTDTLEGGRAVVDMIANDLETMAPSYGISNTFLTGAILNVACPVNYCSVVQTFSFPPTPLFQSLVGSISGSPRTNLLENVFILGKGNISGVPSWIASGYSVTTNLPDGTLYPLYRFYMTTNASSGQQGLISLYGAFVQCQYTNSAVWSHLMDGVVNLTFRTYDTNGVWLTNGYANPLNVHVQNTSFYNSGYGENNCYYFSNAIPASVQFQLGTLEDRTMEHAESLGLVAQSNYLSGAAAQVHLFNRRVWIRNLDPSAYQ